MTNSTDNPEQPSQADDSEGSSTDGLSADSESSPSTDASVSSEVAVGQASLEDNQPPYDDGDDRVRLVEQVYQLWRHCADFHLYIVSPSIPSISPAIEIPPEPISGPEDLEFVYPILDQGHTLSTSKGEEMNCSGMSMCKLYYTIEKMIFLLVERLKTSGVTTETEVQVAFGGHELAQRKAFESIINLAYNVGVTNFDPGDWGEHYLETVKRLADKGYGYPTEAPRDIYRVSHDASTSTTHKKG